MKQKGIFKRASIGKGIIVFILTTIAVILIGFIKKWFEGR